MKIRFLNESMYIYAGEGGGGGGDLQQNLALFFSLHYQSYDYQDQAVRKVDNTIHKINCYSLDNLIGICVSLMLLRSWLVIYQVSSVIIRSSHNQGLVNNLGLEGYLHSDYNTRPANDDAPDGMLSMSLVSLQRSRLLTSKAPIKRCMIVVDS